MRYMRDFMTHMQDSGNAPKQRENSKESLAVCKRVKVLEC